MTDFEKYAVSCGISSNKLNGYQKTTNGLISPTIIEERHLNVASMDVFSALIRERIIYLASGIDSDVASVVSAQLQYLNSVDPTSDISLYINSPGGSCSDGLLIYDVMNLIEADVATYNMAMSASMGSILLSSGEKGKRYALPHSRVMIHQVSSATSGQYADMEIAVREAKKTQDELYNILAINTGKSFEQITADADRDHWFTAQEAIEYGLVDKIVTKRSK